MQKDRLFTGNSPLPKLTKKRKTHLDKILKNLYFYGIEEADPKFSTKTFNVILDYMDGFYDPQHGMWAGILEHKYSRDIAASLLPEFLFKMDKAREDFDDFDSVCRELFRDYVAVMALGFDRSYIEWEWFLTENNFFTKN